jgi:hypothetical protein
MLILMMSSMKASELRKMVERTFTFKGTKCDEGANAYMRICECRTGQLYGTQYAIKYLDIVDEFLRSRPKQAPTPLMQRETEVFLELTISNGFSASESKTVGGRARVMVTLKMLAELEQFDSLVKALVSEGVAGDPPVGYTLYRSEQRSNVMALINNLPEEIKEEVLDSYWEYSCGDKFTGEKIFGYGYIMPL